jgi:DegV family protein with EDD domain
VKKVAIVADSACCLPPQLIEEYDIHLVPLQIAYAGQTYQDGIDISPAEIYKIMRRRDELPTTSNPLTADFLSAYQHTATEAASIFCITVTGLQSMTFDVACMAKEMARDILPETAIEVYDSRAVAGALGFIVLEAARKAKSGGSLGEVINTALTVKERVNAVFMLDTLYYLARTGRVARAASWATTLLDMKPIVEHSPAIGETTPVARPRSRAKAIEYLFRIMGERMGKSKVHAMVHHADESTEGEKLMSRIHSVFDCAELYLTEFPPAMGVHCGPGMLGICFYAD